MSTQARNLNQDDVSPEIRLNNNRLLLTLTMVGLALLFTCLIYANFMVRNAQGSWPPPGVDRLNMTAPLLMTVVLLVSSVTAVLGMRALKSGQRQPMIAFFTVTSVLGLIYAVWMGSFLIGLLAGFRGVYSAMFLAMWFVHVLHAMAVLGLMGYTILGMRVGKYSLAEGYFPVEAAHHLWHFLTVIWIVLFVVLYLV
jgi:cytochrome c oxidase subunit 3